MVGLNSEGPGGRLQLQMTRYLDSFPFDNFIVIRDVEALPEVHSQTLRQFMEPVVRLFSDDFVNGAVASQTHAVGD